MLLFCAKTIVRESCSFKLSHLKKKEKIHLFGDFWFGAFVMLFLNTGSLLGEENTWFSIITA